MLAAFIASAPQDDAPFPTATPTAVINGLRHLGYRFEATEGARNKGDLSLDYPFVPNGFQGIEGRLSRNGASFYAWMRVGGTGKEGNLPRRVWNIDLRIELDFPKELSNELDENALRRNGLDLNIIAIPHLGRTATVSNTLVLSDGSAYASPSWRCVKADLDRLWRVGASFAARHGARFVQADDRDWSRVRLSDALVQRYADEVSLRRATASWGWTPSHPVVRSPEAPWDFRVRTSGTSVRLGLVFEGAFPVTKVYVGNVVDLPRGVVAERWVKIAADDLEKAELERPGWVRLYVGRTLDLRRGAALADLKRRIEGVAGKVAALQKIPGARLAEIASL